MSMAILVLASDLTQLVLVSELSVQTFSISDGVPIHHEVIYCEVVTVTDALLVFNVSPQQYCV